MVFSGITVLAVTMFFSVNALNGSNGNLDLASLRIANIANAEDPGYWPPSDILKCRCHNDGNCYGGNYISFRKKCKDLYPNDTRFCSDFSVHCPE
ncbi:MAG: hypothetical protein ACK5LT_06405 [Lachnospirales bacterium]